MSKLKQTDEGYWLLIEPVWLTLNRSWDDGCEEFLRQFRKVPVEVGHLYAAHWCQSEVCNGGFHQFFSNTTGLLAPEALDGFRAIGVTDLTEVLSEAISFFGGPYPRERAARIALVPKRQTARRETWDPFYPLDERFYENIDGWEQAADAYAAQARRRHS
jgi:hypothetical protein